jgi:predicted SnoaL-like aldol condensation-catalyzing enzyme
LETTVNQSSTERNKAVILELLATAFNSGKDFTALEKYVHPDFAQHNPTIPGGRDGLRTYAASLPDTLRYESGTIVSEGDTVMVHGRYSGATERPLLAVDIFRFQDGLVVEHWDVVQEEVPVVLTTAGLSMFDAPRTAPA